MIKTPEPQLDSYQDFAGLDSDEIDRLGAESFIDGNPAFPQSPHNAQMILKWCSDRGGCASRKNLEIAFRDLHAELEPVPPETSPKTGVPHIEKSDGVARTPKASPDELRALAALRDDCTLSDHARKRRDEALRRLAGEQRRKNSILRVDPRIVI